MLRGIDLKSGKLITAWIDYKNDQKKLMAFLSYKSFKPQDPLLTVDIDLSEYLKDMRYAGFSASTEGSTELHFIQSWSFQTFGFLPARPKSHPHNVSDSSVTIKPPISVPESGSKHHKRLGLGLGIAGPAFFCVVLAVFGYITVKKWRDIKIEKNFKAEVCAGPREFSYKELKTATKGFHTSRILGHGAFRTVYKAFFISSAPRLVCRKGELLLVYGSLDKVLYQEVEQGSLLRWPHRLNIAVGLASVLTYLHQEYWVWGLHSQGKIIEAADKRLSGTFKEEEMRKLLLLGLSCANPDSAERPSMRRVLQILITEVEPVLKPKMKPSLSFFSGLMLSLEDLVSDSEDIKFSQPTLCQIKVN
ncbi:hypothetical protein NL676_035211 [Syzygium grande]|nr:hypothetical protein NL676_035211 [Syzygium grande]